MKQFIFVSSCLFLFSTILSSGNAKVARIDIDDIKALREKNFVDPVDTLADLDQKSPNVTAVHDIIRKLKKDCQEILLSVPDNGTACFIKVKYQLSTIAERLIEFCDNCIAENVESTNPTILNAEQKKCLEDTMNDFKAEIDSVKPRAEGCKQIF